MTALLHVPCREHGIPLDGHPGIVVQLPVDAIWLVPLRMAGTTLTIWQPRAMCDLGDGAHLLRWQANAAEVAALISHGVKRLNGPDVALLRALESGADVDLAEHALAEERQLDVLRETVSAAYIEAVARSRSLEEMGRLSRDRLAFAARVTRVGEGR